MGFNYRLRRNIDQLKRELNKAVETEAFEEAARLRDEIRELEKELKKANEKGA